MEKNGALSLRVEQWNPINASFSSAIPRHKCRWNYSLLEMSSSHPVQAGRILHVQLCQNYGMTISNFYQIYGLLCRDQRLRHFQHFPVMIYTTFIAYVPHFWRQRYDQDEHIRLSKMLDLLVTQGFMRRISEIDDHYCGYRIDK